MQNRKYTEARRDNNRKWDKENLDRISIALPKGRKAELQAVAQRHGLSVNGYIGKLIDEAMEREQTPGEGFRISEPPANSNI